MPLLAPLDGIVSEIVAVAGRQVAEGARIMAIERETLTLADLTCGERKCAGSNA